MMIHWKGRGKKQGSWFVINVLYASYIIVSAVMDLIVLIKIVTIITDTNPFIWIIMLRLSTVSQVCLLSLRHGASSGCGWRRRPPGMGAISKQPGRAEKLEDGITNNQHITKCYTGPLGQQRILVNMAMNLAFRIGRGTSRSGEWVIVRFEKSHSMEFVISNWIDLSHLISYLNFKIVWLITADWEAIFQTSGTKIISSVVFTDYFVNLHVILRLSDPRIWSSSAWFYPGALHLEKRVFPSLRTEFLGLLSWLVRKQNVYHFRARLLVQHHLLQKRGSVKIALINNEVELMGCAGRGAAVRRSLRSVGRGQVSETL
jgi:hypothetical protein